MSAQVRWVDGLKFVATSGSGHAVVMDGDGAANAPSPMEMVLMAAGSCSSVDVVSILQKAKQKVRTVEVKLDGQRAEGTPAVFTDIHMTFVIYGHDVSENHVERAVKLSADKYCSVSIMLGKSVNISHSYEIINEA
ncbi:OsmC family protein [Aliidiomarina halalkaliphila]|uniref:OsmC family protein n=1 Tax=Aliidiomarina halalkaliphila TaxID=2593535 RepID=A0A552X0Z7_9GAMM|nr:OsmC family protein [Aliidiomarina halalkaliphila]TRW48559.1 OsmC family protein [Aliidiomarina halalkaliphila]